jgi:hypothetical protein
VSGSIGDGDVNVLLGVVSGPSNVVAETSALDASSLTLGTWVPLSLDLSASTATRFDASKIHVIGLRFLSSAASPDGGAPDGGAPDGGAPDGGSFSSTHDLVFQIDTVTD